MDGLGNVIRSLTVEVMYALFWPESFRGGSFTNLRRHIQATTRNTFDAVWLLCSSRLKCLKAGNVSSIFFTSGGVEKHGVCYNVWWWVPASKLHFFGFIYFSYILSVKEIHDR